jgi:acyl dehydratase
LKFAEFTPGEIFTIGPYQVEEVEILNFAKQWDPQWFHTDIEAANNGPFNGLIASGWHTCSIAMRMMTDHFLVDSESYASPGLSYIKWPNPVRPNDQLNLKISVIESRISKSNPTLGILRWRWQMSNSMNLEVLDLEATNLFKLS